MAELGWNYFVHEEQRFVADAAAHLAANPTHTITERFLDDGYDGGTFYADYTPSGTAQYIREGLDVWELTITGGVLYLDNGSGAQSVGEGIFLELAGGTMTGDLLLDHDPVQNLEAATKQYVDQEVSAASANAQISVKEDNILVNSGVGILDFGHALDVTDQGSGEMLIEIDESELTTVVFLTGNQTISGNKTFSNDVTVNGNLVVNGTTTSLNVEELLIEDNNFTLNATVTGSPTEDAYMEVERGTEPNAQIYWNESADQWEFGISGSLSAISSAADLSSLSGALSSEIDGDIATYSGFAEGQFVNEAGDSMTGFLTLSADPTDALHAATKQYVDNEVSGASVDVEDDGSSVASGIQTLDFGHALDATDQGSGEVLIDVDESEFTSVLFLAGGTMTGFITLHADPTVSGHAANKSYVDEQVTAVQPTLQVDFTTGTDLDVTQNTLPVSGVTAVNVNGGSFYTVNAANIEISQTGFYKVSWNVEGEKQGGSTQRRILETNLNFNGTQITSSRCSAYVRDATNNNGSCGNSYIVEVTSAGQTVGIRSQQTGSGGGTSVDFILSAGHLLVERLGDN